MNKPSTSKPHAKINRRQPHKFKRPSAQGEIATLNARIGEETPLRGRLPFVKNSLVSFASQPLSQATLQGLESNGYTVMTAIQMGSIPHALAGRDILGAAKTGSGKSLAFLIPMLELLYRKGWTPQDGPGAIVLSPTRELAGQLYAVLRKIGCHHSFSLGLVMGGRNKSNQKIEKNDFIREQQAIATTNILICTPGRLLQHLEQTPYFNVDSLQILILDEADRILDLGFREQLVKILDYLPPGEARQTLLFSATQTKSVKDMATLSINHKTVEYVGVHDHDDETTPDRLKQAYVLVPLEHKLNCLYSFLKSHLKCKTIVFFATCSQVRHAWDLFCRLRPGLSVLAIHGKLSQTKRLQVYDKFTITPHSVMFATDVASRGLDFPFVDWVVQLDAPEDYDMYIHRVGRTARFQQSGQALLLLDPVEEHSFIQDNQEAQERKLKAPLQKKSINPTKTMLVSQRAASLVAEHSTLHVLAKKAFWSYVRSVSLLPKDGIWSDFQIRKLHLKDYALSLGLAEIPGDLELVFQKVSSREGLRETKNVNRKLQRLKEQIRLEKEEKKKKRKLHATGEENERTSSEIAVELAVEIDDLLVKKRQSNANATDDDSENIFLSSPQLRKPKKIRIDASNSASNQHTVFEDDGTEQPKVLERTNIVCSGEDGLRGATENYLKQVQKRLELTRELDRQEERERIREKKKRLKEKSEQAREEAHGGEAQVAALDFPDGMEHDDHPSISWSDNQNGTESQQAGNGGSSSSSSSHSSSDDDGSSTSGRSDDDKADPSPSDIAQQEDLALSLIRAKS
jgi:ATP-dependent RNA helicase DDX10/DBP4